MANRLESIFLRDKYRKLIPIKLSRVLGRIFSNLIHLTRKSDAEILFTNSLNNLDNKKTHPKLSNVKSISLFQARFNPTLPL
jgi:hypothetical protein